VSATGQCWICGSTDHLTGEHQIKVTDLKDLLGEIMPGRTVYLHNVQRANQRIKSWRADRLKSGGEICGICNSTRTQAHDGAWTQMSRALRARVASMKAVKFLEPTQYSIMTRASRCSAYISTS
jgi:ribosomal protein L19E